MCTYPFRIFTLSKWSKALHLDGNTGLSIHFTWFIHLFNLYLFSCLFSTQQSASTSRVPQAERVEYLAERGGHPSHTSLASMTTPTQKSNVFNLLVTVPVPASQNTTLGGHPIAIFSECASKRPTGKRNQNAKGSGNGNGDESNLSKPNPNPQVPTSTPSAAVSPRLNKLTQQVNQTDMLYSLAPGQGQSQSQSQGQSQGSGSGSHGVECLAMVVSGSQMTRRLRRDNKITGLLFLVTFVFILTWIPAYVAMAKGMYTGYSLPITLGELIVMKYGANIYIINNFSNPLIYAALSSVYRAKVRFLFTLLKN